MDSASWEKLAELDPESICRRSGAVREKTGYRLRVFDDEYVICPDQQHISMSRGDANSKGAEPTISNALEMVVVYYLIHARDMPLANEWVGLRELGCGGQFFVSHVPDYGRILPLFSASPDSVIRGALTLSGRQLDTGDATVALRVLPRVPIAFVYWAASDEFPADVSVLFDRTVEQHLPLDVLSTVIQEVIGRLAVAACT